MRKLLIITLIFMLVLEACQKELSDKQSSRVVGDQSVIPTVTNDTIYFNGGSFVGGWSITGNHTMWASCYSDVFHCPSGCTLSYISFKVNYQNGAIVDSLLIFTADDFGDNFFKNVRIRGVRDRRPGATISFKWRTPKPLVATSYGGDSTQREVGSYIKFHGPYKCWIRIMPDSISILSPLGKPLPIKGFNHRDWPDGTPLNIRDVLME